MSLSERRLWSWLKNNQIGFRFRRQYAVGPYILDFYCHEALLCVEVDGDQHARKGNADQIRDQYLAGLGILTHRVLSTHVKEQGMGIARFIQHLCVERTGRPAGPNDLNTPTSILPRNPSDL